MAGLTQRHKVIGGIATRLPALNVMDIQDGVFRLSLTALAHMTAAEKHIFPHIPEIKLLPLLIFCSLNRGILDLLDIE